MKFLGVSLKMYLDHLQTLAWSRQVVEIVGSLPTNADVDLVLFPSLPSIPAVVDLAAGTRLKVGAQNVSGYESGAYTGEVLAASLVQIGCQYVEIGHWERRRLFGENDASVRAKLAVSLKQGLTPLLCIGEAEPITSHEAANHCVAQLEQCLGLLEPAQPPNALVLAYEPQYAIGSDSPANPWHICYVARHVSDWVTTRYPDAALQVVYGGSAGTGLFTSIANEVDGLFLGRAAHDPRAYARILAEVVKT
jgi:triosephosphate isomerase